MNTLKSALVAAVVCFAGAVAAQTPVPLPEFSSLQLRGGGKVVLRYGPQQRVSLRSGSTEFSRLEVRRRRGDNDLLVIEGCERRCPRNYHLVVEIVTPRLPAVAVSGGGSIVAEPGFPRTGAASAAIDGGGSIDLRAAVISNASAAIHGGGKIDLTVRHALSAAVFGGGLISYRGSPALSQAVSGGGAVVRVP